MYPIQCALCDKLVARSCMKYHKQKECKMAIIKCGSCNFEIQRMNMKKHYNQCPEAIVDCDYYRYGCKAMCLKRKNVGKHLEDNVKQHLRLTLLSHANLEEKVKELNQETQKRFENLEEIIYSGMIPSWKS
eukprot:UN03720